MLPARGAATSAAVGFGFDDLHAATDEEAAFDGEEATSAEVRCGIKPYCTRPRAPISNRGNASAV
eukprot:12926383-Prorocentrum_lima.AAC.1